MAGGFSYLATLKLWDVSTGERSGKLLFESDQVRASPLSDLKHHWPELLRQGFKETKIPVARMKDVESLNIRSLRVTLSRGGGAGIFRRRFSWREKDYLVTLHVERDSLANVLQKLKMFALAPGRNPMELTFWETGKGDWAAIEFDESAGVSMFPDEFPASHPVSGEAVMAVIQDRKKPKKGRIALLYELEAI